MSRINLTRKAGESVRLELEPGMFTLLEVISVSFRDGVCIRLSCQGLETTNTVRVQHDLEVIPGVFITVVSVKFGSVRLVFAWCSTHHRR